MTNRALAGTENSAIFVSALSSLLMRKELCKVPAVHFKTTVIRHTIYIVKKFKFKKFFGEILESKDSSSILYMFCRDKLPNSPSSAVLFGPF